MIMSNFIGRKRELEQLNNLYNNSASLVLVNGMHQIGKTEFLKQFSNDKNAYVFSAGEVSDNLNKDLFKRAINNYIAIEPSTLNELTEWEDLFKIIATNDSENKLLIIDNFDNLVQKNPDFLKEFSNIWTKVLKPNNVFTVLSISNNKILKYLENQRNTLNDLIDVKIPLNQLTLLEILQSFPNKSLPEVVSLYSVIGGVPYYWSFFNSNKTLYQQLTKLNKLAINSNGYFHSLPISLLQKDIWETMNYMSILFLISQGYKTFKELQERTNLKRASLIQCLSNLELLGYIKAKVPVLDKKFKIKNAIFEINNPIFNYWFKYIYPNKSLMFSNPKMVDQIIKNDFPNYLEETFRNISQELLLSGLEQHSIDFSPNIIGSYWNDNINIPLVAIDNQNKEVIFVDTSFSLKDYNLDNFIDFIEKIENEKDFKKFKNYKKIYGLYTLNNPTDDLMRYALDNPNIYLFSGTNLFKKTEYNPSY